MTPLETLGAILLTAFGIAVALFRRYYMPSMPSTDHLDTFPPEPYIPSSVPPIMAPTETKTPPVTNKTESNLLWDTKEHVRHSVRVICDEEGLDLEQKDTMCATIGAESIGYNIKAINKNYIIKNGIKILASTDFGLCQWNDYWHGKEISPEDALNNPEKAVRLMCQYWKRGQRDLWIAYKNGSYKQYLV